MSCQDWPSGVAPGDARVHNHGPSEGKGLACREHRPNGRLVGECIAPLPGDALDGGFSGVEPRAYGSNHGDTVGAIRWCIDRVEGIANGTIPADEGDAEDVLRFARWARAELRAYEGRAA